MWPFRERRQRYPVGWRQNLKISGSAEAVLIGIAVTKALKWDLSNNRDDLHGSRDLVIKEYGAGRPMRRIYMEFS